MTVDEHTVVLASATTFFRSAPPQAAGGLTPVFIHGVPTSSDIWTPVLERIGGIAPDLPGFGRSDKGGHLDYSVRGLAETTGALIDHLELDPVALVGHGWGAVIALDLAAARSGRIERVVAVDPLALVQGFTWPRLARILRTRGAGELAMGAVTRRSLAAGLRRRATTPQAWNEARVAAAWQQFDQGTQRAILRLHRSTNADHLEQLAPRLSGLPALVVYGESDTAQGGDHAQRLARLLPLATVTGIPGAGHWPWLDRPDTVDAIAAFLGTP